jgi:hypothetical protein
MGEVAVEVGELLSTCTVPVLVDEEYVGRAAAAAAPPLHQPLAVTGGGE